MKPNLIKALCLSLLCGATSHAASTLFWDANGAAGCGGAGNWGSTAVQGNFWGTACDTGLGVWANGNLDSASLGGTGVTITLTNGVTVNKIIVNSSGYIVAGASTLTFSGAGAGVDWNSQGISFQLACPYAGSLFTKTGSGRVNLNNANATVSKYLVQGGEISTAAISRFGTAPGSLVADFLTLDGGGWGIDTGSQDLGATRGITLNAGGGFFGQSALTIWTTISAPITGVGGLTITGGGPFALSAHTSGANLILANTANNYQGGTTLATGSLRLNTSGVIPDSSTVTVSGGTFDLSGFIKTLTLTAGGSGYTATPNVAFSGGGGSGATATTAMSGGVVTSITLTGLGTGYTSAPTVTLTGTGGSGATATATVAAGPFNETVGNVVLTGGTIAGTGGTLTGTNYDVQSGTISAILAGGSSVKVTKSGAGTVVLSGTNTYTGKTIVNGGLLTLNNPSGQDSVLGAAPASPVADQLTISNGAAISLGSASAVTFATNRGITLGAGGGMVQGASSDLTIPGNIVGTGSFTKTNSANLTLFGANSFAGNFNIFGGGVRFNGNDTAGHGTIVVGPTTATVTLRNLSPTITSSVTNNITLNAGGTSDIDVTCVTGNTFTLSGNISGTGYMTRGRATGTSGNVVLSGDNSAWSGGLFWGRGLLTLGHKNALGTGTLTSTNAPAAAGESNVLMSATSLAGVNAVANAVNLTGLMLIAGANDLELSGAVTLASGANTITNRDSGAFAISGAIGGAGALTISGPSTTVFSGVSANTYAGATIVNGSLDVQKAGGLSSGNVTVNNGATLKLGLGAANTYIASSANLLLNGSATVNLAFTGTPNTINALSFDGGATFKAPGTWGAIGSGAAHEDGRFSGAGMLNVTTGPASATALATSANPSVYGTLTFTATVTGAGSPSGTVTFYDAANPIGTSPLVAGVASLNAATLEVAGSPHSITAVYSGDNNFGGSTSSAIAQTVNPKSVSALVAVGSRSYDGTTVGTITSRSLTGVVGTDDVNLGTSGSAAFIDKDIGTGKSVTVSGLALSGTTAGNYTLASSTVNTTANITAIALSVTGLSATSKVYDGNTTAALTGTAALSAGVVGSEDVSLTGTAAGAFVNKNAANGKTVNVTGLTLAGADIGNYTLTPLALTANITAAPLTVTGITANNKPFDGGTNATLVLSNAVLAGVIGGEDVTLVTTNAAGAFQDPNVGDGKPVDITGLQIAGADIGNYALTQPSTTADIKNALGVSGITASDKVYDGTTTATINVGGATLVGVVGTDDVTLNTGSATGAFSDKNVAGGKTVAIGGLTLSGADASKYLLTNVTTTASITAASLTLTGLTAQNKTYDGTAAAAVTGTPALSGIIGSDAVSPSGSASGTFASSAAGTGIAVSVTGISLSGADAGNYSLTPLALSANINQATLTITGLAAQSRTYNQGMGAAITGTPALSGIIGSDNVSLTGTPAGAFGNKNVGVGKPVTVSGLSLTGGDAGNYSLAALILSADINALVLTQTGIIAQNKVYDGTTAVTFGGTMTVPGIISGDAATLSGTPSGSFGDKTVANGKSVSFGGVFLTGADAGNYDLQLQLLSADITAASLSVTGLSAANKVYDSTTAATVNGTPALSGVIGSDVVTLNGTASGAFNNKTVGTGKPVTVSGLTTTGADAGNYTLAALTLSADITSAPLSVTGLSASNKVYDGTTTATITGTGALSGIQGSDVVTLNGTPAGVFADKNVGTGKSVAVSGLSLGGADQANYSFTALALSADITSLATVNNLVTSTNYAALGSNVTFTATLAGSPAAADSPSGSVVFLANGTPFSTNALAGGVAATSSSSLPLGTNVVSAEYAGDANFLGSTSSVQQVIYNPVTCSQVNNLLGISDNQDGTLNLSFLGTPQAEYYVLSSSDVTAAMGSWTVLAGSTNTVTNLSGLWNFTVTNDAAQKFYRSAAIVPCP